MELIDKEALMTDMGIAQGCGMSCADCEKINCLTGEIIDRQPTIDAEPVRNGEWIDTEPIYNYECHQSAHYKCSECGRRTGYKQTRSYNFCPKCGAKMDK